MNHLAAGGCGSPGLRSSGFTDCHIHSCGVLKFKQTLVASNYCRGEEENQNAECESE